MQNCDKSELELDVRPKKTGYRHISEGENTRVKWASKADDGNGSDIDQQ